MVHTYFMEIIVNQRQNRLDFARIGSMHGWMKKRIKQCNSASLANDLVELSGLDRDALVEQWRSIYKPQPPANISRSLLIRAIAYRLQENALSGLKPSAGRFLAQVAEDASAGRKSAAPPSVIKSGTRLLREWHGVTHEVIILNDGVQYQGKSYRSLSEVARIITGARWSGPLFFGLKKREAA